MYDIGNFGLQVVEVARSAGHAILAIYTHFVKENKGELVVTQKKDNSPVSLADLTAHHIICTGLRQLSFTIPIVSEEDPSPCEERTSYTEFWLIDPLDGTKEFLRGSDEFTVNIALIRHGKPVWGVVFAPAINRMYWGGRNLGAYRECAGSIEPISVKAPIIPGTPYRVIASKSHLNKETREFIATLGDVTIIEAGSSLKFCRVAEGIADIYPRLGPTSEWDTAAAQAVVEGAGGYVVCLDGTPLCYGKADILNPCFIATSALFKELRIEQS